jgi:hypothetical protein
MIYGNFVKFDYDNRVEAGDQTELAYNLPDIKQTDFLLTLVNQYNLIMQTDNSSKTVRLELFDTILANKPVALIGAKRLTYHRSRNTFSNMLNSGRSRISNTLLMTMMLL